ncbi:uncharacterized protein BDV17DRAFT_263666 [Aspergillus undulatus]|uniref:uncharacterized protein n=1 Tax=Aspergillus undulatus TaxID=1810928 RepID=UPI003CCDE841
MIRQRISQEAGCRQPAGWQLTGSSKLTDSFLCLGSVNPGQASRSSGIPPLYSH